MIIARNFGTNSANPIESVIKPGVIKSKPATKIKTPLDKIKAVFCFRFCKSKITLIPWCLTANEPIMAVAIIIKTVHINPTISVILINNIISNIGIDIKNKKNFIKL